MKKEIIWLVRGSQRKEIFLRLSNKPFFPNKLRKGINSKGMTLSLREISRHLRDFEKFGLVDCLNKEDPYNRIYRVTEKGKRTQNRLRLLEI